MPLPSPSAFHHARVTAFVILALSAVTGSAQQIRRDPALDRFAGSWKGAYETMGETHDCIMTAAWTLDDAFLETTLKVFRDASHKALMLEERQMLRTVDDEQQSSYVFTSEGVTRWGSWIRQGSAWELTMSWSTGLREAGLVSQPDADSIDYMSTIHNENEDIVQSVRIRLQRSR